MEGEKQGGGGPWKKRKRDAGWRLAVGPPHIRRYPRWGLLEGTEVFSTSLFLFYSTPGDLPVKHQFSPKEAGTP